MDRRNRNRDEEKSGLKAAAEEGDSPVIEVEVTRSVSGVTRDTRNLVRRREDHLPRLNTTQ